MTRTSIFMCWYLLLFSCTPKLVLKDSSSVSIRIKSDSIQVVDSAAYALIAPYQVKLTQQMNEVIGYTQATLNKELPEGTLNNLVTDAAMYYCTRKAGMAADVCMMNYGGIRIPKMEPGDITLGKVFELMPFENQICVLKITGSQLMELLRHVAAHKGAPVSGVKMKIKSGILTEVYIQQKPIDTLLHYTLVTSDYLANGGDRLTMLQQPIQRTDLGYLVRDAIVAYIKANSPLNMKKDGRIVIEP